MIELRRSPRTNVTWRAAVRMPDGRLVLTKVINISAEGLMMLCPENLHPSQQYPMMVEIPAIDQPAHLHKVGCTAVVRHSILSGDIYRIGVQLSDISDLHRELVAAWTSRALRSYATG